MRNLASIVHLQAPPLVHWASSSNQLEERRPPSCEQPNGGSRNEELKSCAGHGQGELKMLTSYQEREPKWIQLPASLDEDATLPNSLNATTRDSEPESTITKPFPGF